MRVLPRAAGGRRPFPKCASCPGRHGAEAVPYICFTPGPAPHPSDSLETGHILGCARKLKWRSHSWRLWGASEVELEVEGGADAEFRTEEEVEVEVEVGPDLISKSFSLLPSEVDGCKDLCKTRQEER